MRAVDEFLAETRRSQSELEEEEEKECDCDEINE